MCPPGVDQTTRTAQRYHLIVPELQQRIQRDEETWRERGFSHQFLGNYPSSWIWSILATPIISNNTRVTSSQRGPTRLSSLESLPNELLAMIIDHLLAAKDPEKRKEAKRNATALGLCSEFLLEMILYRIRTEYLRYSAPWAGKKLALQGSWTTDLPEPFEANGLAAQFTPNYGGRMCSARRFNWHAWENFDTPTLMCNEEIDWITAVEDRKLAPTLHSRVVKQLSVSEFFPQDRPWLLRNLTTKEIVKLESSPDRKHLNGLSEPLGFQHVLVPKIFWTSQPQWGEQDLEVHRGPWAGHCFDIVTLDDHSAGRKLDEWSDVSSTIVSEVEALYKKLQPTK